MRAGKKIKGSGGTIFEYNFLLGQNREYAILIQRFVEMLFVIGFCVRN